MEVIDKAIAASCTEDGLTEGKHCSVCKEVLVKQEVVKAKGHDYINGICSSCGKQKSFVSGGMIYTVIATKDGSCQVTHVHQVVVDKSVKATCTNNGKTEGSHCSTCGEIIVAQKVITKKGHSVVADPAVSATIYKTGLTQGSHCSVCGAVIKKRLSTPKLAPVIKLSATKKTLKKKKKFTPVLNRARRLQFSWLLPYMM